MVDKNGNINISDVEAVHNYPNRDCTTCLAQERQRIKEELEKLVSRVSLDDEYCFESEDWQNFWKEK